MNPFRLLCSMLPLTIATPALAQSEALLDSKSPIYLAGPSTSAITSMEFDPYPGFSLGVVPPDLLKTLKKGAAKPKIGEGDWGLTVAVPTKKVPAAYQGLLKQRLHGLNAQGEVVCQASGVRFELGKPVPSFQDREDIDIFGHTRLPRDIKKKVKAASFFWGEEGEAVELLVRVDGDCTFALGSDPTLFVREAPVSVRKPVEASDALKEKLLGYVRGHVFHNVLQADYDASIQHWMTFRAAALERIKQGKATEEDQELFGELPPEEFEQLEGEAAYVSPRERTTHPKRWIESGEVKAAVWHLEAPAGYAVLSVGSEDYCAAPQTTWFFRLDAQGEPHLLHMDVAQRLSFEGVLADVDGDTHLDLLSHRLGRAAVWHIKENDLKVYQVPGLDGLQCDNHAVPPLQSDSH